MTRKKSGGKAKGDRLKECKRALKEVERIAASSAAPEDLAVALKKFHAARDKVARELDAEAVRWARAARAASLLRSRRAPPLEEIEREGEDS